MNFDFEPSFRSALRYEKRRYSCRWIEIYHVNAFSANSFYYYYRVISNVVYIVVYYDQLPGLLGTIYRERFDPKSNYRLSLRWIYVYILKEVLHFLQVKEIESTEPIVYIGKVLPEKKEVSVNFRYAAP